MDAAGRAKPCRLLMIVPLRAGKTRPPRSWLQEAAGWGGRLVIEREGGRWKSEVGMRNVEGRLTNAEGRLTNVEVGMRKDGIASRNLF